MDDSEGRCCACRKQFGPGDEVVTFRLETVRRGEKSGQLGFYAHGNYPEDFEDHTHFSAGCLEKTFSPMDNPFMYDAIADKVREEIESEIRDEIYDELSAEFQTEDVPLYAEDELPFCLWCKKTNTVWLQHRHAGIIFFCTVCQKYWDDEETELESADPSQLNETSQYERQ